MQQELRQTTNTGEVIINDDLKHRQLKFSNGGISGEFEIIVTDQQPVPELFQPVGQLPAGKYTIKGNYAGKDYREIKLDGAYTVYGNSADGNVMLVPVTQGGK